MVASKSRLLATFDCLSSSSTRSVKTPLMDPSDSFTLANLSSYP